VAEGVVGGEDGSFGPGAAGAEDADEVDCAEAVHQLYDYLDGELTEARRRKIVAHLDRCGSCADAAGFEYELRVVIANRCRDRVPESLMSRIAEAIHEEEGRRDDVPSSRGGTP